MSTDHDIMNLLAETLRQGAPLRVAARGLSMGRRFSRVDEVVIRPERPHLGSVIVFRRAGQWIAHRVIWHVHSGSETIYITRGDGELTVDRPFIRESECVGVVTGVGQNGYISDLSAWQFRLAAAWGVAAGWLWWAMAWIRHIGFPGRMRQPAHRA